MFAPGDGSVTLSSLLSRQDMGSAVPHKEQATPEIERELIVCARHDALTSDEDLLHALISICSHPTFKRAELHSRRKRSIRIRAPPPALRPARSSRPRAGTRRAPTRHRRRKARARW